MGGKARFVWHDLMAADVGGAKRFYGELFGWTFKPGNRPATSTSPPATRRSVGS